MDQFDMAWADLEPLEGGYSNDPADPGGETMWGITKAVARAAGYPGEMRDLPKETAKAIARATFWQPLHLDEIAALSPALAQELFDINFNMWQPAAGLWLQEALNALNQQSRLYPDLRSDGIIGSSTLEALRAYLKARPAGGIVVLMRCLVALRINDYLHQARQNPAKERFVFGWVLNRGGAPQ